MYDYSHQLLQQMLTKDWKTPTTVYHQQKQSGISNNQLIVTPIVKTKSAILVGIMLSKRLRLKTCKLIFEPNVLINGCSEYRKNIVGKSQNYSHNLC